MTDMPKSISTTPSNETSSESPRKAVKAPASFPGMPASTPAKPTPSVANFANVARTVTQSNVVKETRNTSSPMGAWAVGSVGSSTDLSQEMNQLSLSTDFVLPILTPTTNDQQQNQSQQSPQQQQQPHQQQLQPPQQFDPLPNHIHSDGTDLALYHLIIVFNHASLFQTSIRIRL